jgi:HK97 family phage major capsid protein
MNSITLKENRAELVETMEAILDSAKSEDRDLSTDESNSWDGFDTEIKALDKKIAIAERQEQLNKSIAVNMSVQNTQDIAKKEMKSWSLFKAVRDIQNGGLKGVEKEMHQEAENEKRGTLNGIGLPSFMTNKAEQRAFVDQGASGIAPVAVNAFADALIEDSLWNRVGLTNLGTLAADTVVPITGANAVEWAAENAAGTDTSTDFGKITLSPKRINGYANLSNVIVMQNGAGAEAAIMADMGRQIGKKIDANMFASANAAAGPACIVGTAGTLTFTESAAGGSAGAVSDMLEAIQTLADDHGLSGNLGFVNQWALYSNLKAGVEVSGVKAIYNDDRISGYPAWFSSAPATAGGPPITSADGLFGDFSRIYFAAFGPTNILVDPYSAATENAVRLVVNQHYDFAVASGNSFVKYTTVL